MDRISIMEEQLTCLQDLVNSSFLRMFSGIKLLKCDCAKFKAEQLNSDEDKDSKDFTYISHVH